MTSPLSLAPPRGTVYWSPDTSFHRGRLICSFTWGETVGDWVRLSSGMCHLTEKDAEAHIQALIGFRQLKSRVAALEARAAELLTEITLLS